MAKYDLVDYNEDPIDDSEIDRILKGAAHDGGWVGLFQDIAGADRSLSFLKRTQLEDDDYVDEALSQYSYEYARDALKNAGIEEASTDYDEFLSDVSFAFQEAVNYDLHSVMPNLLVRHPGFDTWEEASDSSDEHMSEFSKTDIYAFVKDFISAEHIEEVVRHNFQSGGGIGVYVLATEYEIAPEIGATGHVVLASHNFMSGDADYAESKSDDTVVFSSMQDLVDAADQGKTSIGAVFGTHDWAWK